MPQIVFYQSGVGTGTGALQNIFDQGTGLSLGSKIEEAYSFIVDNYQPGDELLFFGFSRGAYTVRCISGLINWCGVLSKVEMTHFADIWAAYQRRDPDKIESEVEAAQVLYEATLRYPSAENEALATNMYHFNIDNNVKLSVEKREMLKEQRKTECNQRRNKALVVPPQIKVVGVWDTVSALGVPGMFQDNAMIDFFDFYHPGLGSNIQFGFHAVSLEEDRKDFLPTMWYQPPPSSTSSSAALPPGTPTKGNFGVRGQHMRTKQLLKQCWFQGVHTDCGGGYQYHGLSDISLIWMVSQLVDPHTLPDGSTTLRPLLNIDLGLLATILDRRREWAQQLPHRSRPTVNYQHFRTVHQRRFDAETMKRTVWANMAKTGRTFESIHASVPRGGRIKAESHPAFAELRKYDPAKLEQMWTEAEDWEGSLRPTEKMLYWAKRGPYPWVPPVGGHVTMNPLVAPLVITGGWNIPELAGSEAKQLVIDAAASTNTQGMGDVDGDVDAAQGGDRSGRNEGVDVDDTMVEGGWGDIDSNAPTQGGKSSSETKTSSPAPPTKPAPLILRTATPTPDAAYPIIPAKELGENPIDPLRHPHLHTIWASLYNFASSPNALFVDLFNVRIVPKGNLNQTMVQGWLWDLGDKVGGYSDEVKIQALTAGLPKRHRTKGKGKKWKSGKVAVEHEDAAKSRPRQEEEEI